MVLPDFDILKKRIEAASAFKDQHRALEENLNAGVFALKLAKQKQREDLFYVYNINQFCTLFNYDLSVLLHDLHFNKSEWKGRFYTRVIALSIVEFFEDIGQLLGKKFRDRISLINNQKVDIERLSLITKDLNNLRSKHEKSLRQIRNAVIAHKEHDTMSQIKIIGELDVGAINLLSIDIMRWLTSFTNFSTDLIKVMKSGEMIPV